MTRDHRWITHHPDMHMASKGLKYKVASSYWAHD